MNTICLLNEMSSKIYKILHLRTSIPKKITERKGCLTPGLTTAAEILRTLIKPALKKRFAPCRDLS